MLLLSCIAYILSFCLSTCLSECLSLSLLALAQLYVHGELERMRSSNVGGAYRAITFVNKIRDSRASNVKKIYRQRPVHTITA